MKRITVYASLAVLLTVWSGLLPAQGLQLSQPDQFGVSLTATHPDVEGVKSSAMGPGVEVYAKYKLSPTFAVSAGTGYSTAMDKSFSWEHWKTDFFPTFELKAILQPSQNNVITPMAFAGLNAFGWKSTVKMLNQTSESDTYYDGAFVIGAGLQFALNEKTSFVVSGDYRYTFTAEGDEKPKFWAAKAGLAFSMKPPSRSFRKEDEIEYPMGEQELATLDDLFKEDTGKGSSDDDALSLLFQPEQGAASGLEESKSEDEDFADLFGEETEEGTSAPEQAESSAYPDTDIGQLMAKVDRLKAEMDQRSRQIDELQAKVGAGIPAGGTAGPALGEGEFKSRYEAALNQFHMRNYRDAISRFQALAASNPRHMLASNCHYWIGESYNAMGDYRSALSAFKTVLSYSTSYKLDDALIMSGLCYLKLGDSSTARTQFQELVSQYPQSEYAPKAMRYLGTL
ncbi:MAG: tetratricopeptide repeat protein [bacterium]|nr:tetratricopeptide repeat protein [bacterium]